MRFISNLKNDKCSNCGNCCGNLLPLSQTEIGIIKNYIKDHDIKEQKHRNALTCPFRDHIKRICTIYEVRPYICRMWRCDGAFTKKQNKLLLKVKRKATNMRKTFFK